ncbi:MAG TPA: methyltransferase domain-containing protein [Gaiellaceae bacterium]|nr:methyltransferase domain-containing protein [Gaiellaceae bacterium]
MDPRLAAELEVGAVTEEEFVARAYRLLLRRDPEPAARERDLVKLREGTLSRATLLAELAGADEFARVRALDDAIAFAGWARATGERPRELSAPPGDERAIEIPWCLSRYRPGERLLDVGYAFAEPAYLAALTRLGAPEVVGVDLATAEVPGIRAVVADVRRLPFADGAFDVAICISTLEHIGRDNRVYGLAEEQDEGGPLAALNELRRVAGRLLLSVPTGERDDLDWLVQLPPDEWLALFERAGFLVFEHETYALGGEGWRSEPGFEPAGVRFAGDHAAAVLCAELHPATLGRRAREALRRLRA